jgi:hypothetical protein
MNPNRKIEFSPEVEPMLRVMAEKVDANAVILYRYIDIENVEIAELFELLSESPVVKNNENNLDAIFSDLERGKKIRDFIDDFKKGTLEYETNVDYFNFLKKNIKILRFTEYAEQTRKIKNFGYDYTERPPKYLVFSDDILTDANKAGNNKNEINEILKRLNSSYNKEDLTKKIKEYETKQIEKEGMTAYFMRAGISAFYEKDDNVYQMNKTFIDKTDLDTNKAHIHSSQTKSDRIFGNHSAAWVLLKGESNDDAIGCLRFEFALDKDDKSKKDINNALESIFSVNTIELFNRTVNDVFNDYEKESYEKKYSCLDPILKELVDIDCQFKKKRVKEEDKIKLFRIEELEKQLDLILIRIKILGEQKKESEDQIVKKQTESDRMKRNWEGEKQKCEDGKKSKECGDAYIEFKKVETELKDLKTELKDLNSRINRETEYIEKLNKEFENNVKECVDLLQKIAKDPQKAEYLNQKKKRIDEIIKPIKDRNTLIKLKNEVSGISDEAKKAVEAISINNQELEKLLNIHNRIKHLFFVFKRNAYYGDLIYLRVNKFIEILLDELGLPKESFSKVWNSLQKQEDLMLYDLQDYRDHFMHQFHVFVMGYIFIHKYGVNKLKEHVNKIYPSKNHTRKKDFTSMDILRIWTLTSLFHDCGYSFEKLPKGLEMFTENTMNAKLQSLFKWDAFFFNNQSIITSLQNATNYFNTCPCSGTVYDQKDVFRSIIHQGIMNNDHGVISALILLQQFRCTKKNVITGDKKENEVSPLINLIVNISAVSIAVHNKVFVDICEQGNPRICFYQNPFAFLLVYFDTVQEWGRKRSNSSKCSYVFPELESIDFEDVKNEEKPRIFKVELCYTPKVGYDLPTRIEILEKINKVCQSFFTTSEFMVEVLYILGDSETFKSRIIQCYGVTDDCPVKKSKQEAENEEDERPK